MAESKAVEQMKKKMDIADEVDGVIKVMCKEVKRKEVTSGEYADIVKALAELVIARAHLI